MDKKTKASCILFAAIILIFFISFGTAYPDAPGVQNPGKRVPARTAKAAVKKKPVKKVTKPANTQPVPSALKLTPDVNPLDKAVELIKQEKYKKAAQYIFCAVSEQPGNADVWYWFGVWSDRTGNFTNAQKYFTKALAIDPKYPALSRIVVYPRDPYEKNPLWDSIRPPVIEAIYPIRGTNAVEYDSFDYPGDYSPETPIYRPPTP